MFFLTFMALCRQMYYSPSKHPQIPHQSILKFPIKIEKILCVSFIYVIFVSLENRHGQDARTVLQDGADGGGRICLSAQGWRVCRAYLLFEAVRD